MSIAGITRELLVRYLDTWAPGALHASRGATFVQAWGGAADVDAAEAALRVFAEFADRLGGNRRLTVVPVAADVTGLRERLELVQEELGTPAELSVFPVQGFDRLPAALKAAGSAGAPLLSCVDADEPFDVAVLTRGKPAEVLLTVPAGDWAARRQVLRAAGFTLTAGVELVGGGAERLLAFGTGSAKSLEAFKDELWALDDYAGVRFRDPNDPDGQLMDISLAPNPGALRRELLDHLRSGDRTVTELKHFALTGTVYRAADATKVITALLHAGAVRRTPEGGRLGGDVVISRVAR